MDLRWTRASRRATSPPTGPPYMSPRPSGARGTVRGPIRADRLIYRSFGPSYLEMPEPPAAASRNPSTPAGLEQARRLLAQAGAAEGHADRTRYLEGLKAYLAFVEHHRKELEEAAGE